MLIALVVALVLLFEPIAAVRQYVEIERRHSLNANNPAKTFSFVFGFVMTFLSIIIIILFAWPHIKIALAAPHKTKVVQVTNQAFSGRTENIKLLPTIPEFSFAPDEDHFF